MKGKAKWPPPIWEGFSADRQTEIAVYLDGRNVAVYLNGPTGGFTIGRADVREMAGEILKVTSDPIHHPVD